MDRDNSLYSTKVRVRLRHSLLTIINTLAVKEQRSMASMIGVLLDEAITARSSA
jgi:hypothetical protein